MSALGLPLDTEKRTDRIQGICGFCGSTFLKSINDDEIYCEDHREEGK